MKTIWKKFKVFWREVGNVLTNLLCPVVSAIAAGMELCQMPASWIKGVKKFEYWLFYACSTKDKIDHVVDKVDEALKDIEDKEVE